MRIFQLAKITTLVSVVALLLATSAFGKKPEAKDPWAGACSTPEEIARKQCIPDDLKSKNPNRIDSGSSGGVGRPGSSPPKLVMPPRPPMPSQIAPRGPIIKPGPKHFCKRIPNKFKGTPACGFGIFGLPKSGEFKCIPTNGTCAPVCRLVKCK